MKKRNSIVTLGMTSLFLIFSVLCMVIFSLLSLNTSRSDRSMSEQTLLQTQKYYEACSTAAQLCLEIEDHLVFTYQSTENKEDFYKQLDFFQIDSLNQFTFDWNEETSQLSFEIPYSDTQALTVTLHVLYPYAEHDVFLNISSWKTIVIGEWNPDTKQSIFQGD